MPEYGKDGFPTATPNYDEINYISDRLGATILIGQYEPNYTILDTLELGTYQIGEKYMGIHDPVWGECLIGDEPYDAMLLQLARTPLFRRAQAIEQLTLGPNYATMPNGMYFSRWQHIWGSLAFVRKMTEGDSRFDPRERMVLQLRTLLSDVGHTAFSHLGDWLFQGTNAGDDLHDQELKSLLTTTGISAILDKYGFTLDETVFPEVKDWVECPSPNLCVDRVDYGMRELLRWSNHFLRLYEYKSELSNPKSLFEINDDLELVITDKGFAQKFAAGYGILPTEHWNHPVQNTQLYLLENAVKGALLEGVAQFGEHPRDAMFGIDADFEQYFRTWDVMHFDKLLRDIALSQRYIFTTARQYDLARVFYQETDAWRFPEFPHPLESYSWQSREHGGPYAPQIEVEEAEVAAHALRTVAAGIQVDLPRKKPRSIDPVIKQEQKYLRLSEVDCTYQQYLDGQRKVMSISHMATILVRSGVAKIVAEKYDQIQADWEQAVQLPRSPRAVAERIAMTMPFAAARSFDSIYESDDRDITKRAKR